MVTTAVIGTDSPIGIGGKVTPGNSAPIAYSL